MAKLKPCPFCGGKAQIMKMGYPHWIYCEECGAQVHGRTCDEKDSIKAWNRRYEETIYTKDRCPICGRKTSPSAKEGVGKICFNCVNEMRGIAN